MEKRARAHVELATDAAGRFERKREPPPHARGRYAKRGKAPKAAKVAASPSAAPASSAPIVKVMTPEGPVDKLTSVGIAKIERAQQLIQDVFVESLETVQDQLCAFDLDPDAPDEVPAHWRAELPDEIAIRRRQRVAQAGLMSKKEAPVALETARAVVQNTLRMQNKQMNVMNVKKLNVAVVVGGVKSSYPELEILSADHREDD
jgi:hypothetical protein